MFGFEGWFLKVNGVVFPNKYIHAGTYKITPDQETDQDDYTDGDGVFHRNILPAKATKIEFNVNPLRLADMAKVMEIIPQNANELMIEYWNPRKMRYQSGRAYVPDISYDPYMSYPGINDILFNPFRVAFIEYGEVR